MTKKFVYAKLEEIRADYMQKWVEDDTGEVYWLSPLESKPNVKVGQLAVLHYVNRGSCSLWVRWQLIDKIRG